MKKIYLPKDDEAENILKILIECFINKIPEDFKSTDVSRSIDAYFPPGVSHMIDVDYAVLIKHRNIGIDQKKNLLFQIILNRLTPLFSTSNFMNKYVYSKNSIEKWMDKSNIKIII